MAFTSISSVVSKPRQASMTSNQAMKVVIRPPRRSILQLSWFWTILLGTSSISFVTTTRWVVEGWMATKYGTSQSQRRLFSSSISLSSSSSSSFVSKSSTTSQGFIVFHPSSRTSSRTSLLWLSLKKKDDVGDDDSAEDWFKQRRGESDINFIKRLTTQAPPSPKKQQVTQSSDVTLMSTNATTTTTTTTKGYQKIEDWDAEQKTQKNGTLSWEQKVQFDGLRNGNQIRQNDILMRHINSGF